jgi:hypothetical protein
LPALDIGRCEPNPYFLTAWISITFKAPSLSWQDNLHDGERGRYASSTFEDNPRTRRAPDSKQSPHSVALTEQISLIPESPQQTRDAFGSGVGVDVVLGWSKNRWISSRLCPRYCLQYRPCRETSGNLRCSALITQTFICLAENSGCRPRPFHPFVLQRKQEAEWRSARAHLPHSVAFALLQRTALVSVAALYE